MKALILAAGYATRLSPLTDDFPKGLLPVGGRAIVDWILENVERAGVDDVHLVTNARFAPHFEAWARDKDVTVHDDGTSTNETRLGAIGDLRFVDLADDALVIAGDNLFEYELADLLAFWRRDPAASAVAVHDVGSLELAKKYGVIDVDGDRIVSFEEKPAEPRSTLVATANYVFSHGDLDRIDDYLAEGNSPDQPGNFVAWLQRVARVNAFRFAGGWHDVGDHGQLLEADNRLRLQLGLPERASYTVD